MRNKRIAKPSLGTKVCLAAVFIVAFTNPSSTHAADDDGWAKIQQYFSPPAEFAGKMGTYRSPLIFEDGSEVKTSAIGSSAGRKFWRNGAASWESGRR